MATLLRTFQGRTNIANVRQGANGRQRLVRKRGRLVPPGTFLTNARSGRSLRGKRY